jgi:anti-repressor protein
MENELFNVNMETETVSARELHEKLKIETPFRKWFPRMCEYGFVDGIDYTLDKFVHPQNGQETADYDVKFDMAKQICMIQRTEEGKKCRQYFIDLEKAWNTPEQIMARALKLADRTINSLRIENEMMKPKAAFFDAVADSKTAVSMNEVSKVLDIKGIGRNKLFEILRDKHVLDRRNIPYQKYVDLGWFRVIEQHYSRNGEEQISFKTLVYQKGVEAIRKLLESV